MRCPPILWVVIGSVCVWPRAHASDTGAGAPFEYKADRFADIQVLRYQVPGFEQLSLQQKKLAYYLAQAGLAGRDIFWDQKYRYNLVVRKTLEGVLQSYRGERKGGLRVCVARVSDPRRQSPVRQAQGPELVEGETGATSRPTSKRFSFSPPDRRDHADERMNPSSVLAPPTPAVAPIVAAVSVPVNRFLPSFR